ncbi:MAG: carboxypeptidase regulatory-like domain-containing protein [Prevotellaceae bacterium]|jgi:hypothetical protein|nr:carboxypeptidase regulatory-like domain-containing protein [Prevotellaceae bacterium]
MKKIIYLMMAATLLCGCTKKETEPEELPGSIYGVITDKATGEPVQSAGVQLSPSGTKTVTGSEGQYEFTGLKAGAYSISVTKTGYTDLADYKITVAAGKTAKGDVQLEKLPPSLRVVNDSKQNIDMLDFGDAAGDVTRSFSIFNDGPISLEWQLTETSEWITGVSKAEGALSAGATQAVIITIDRDRLASGENTTTIHVTSNNGSKQLTVKATENRKLPVLITLDATDITASTAVFHGIATDVGVPAYTERGFVYSASSMPTVENTIAKLTVAAIVADSIEYTAIATGLDLERTYYVRAYAINKAGTAYSTNEVSFTTEMALPKVTTQDVTNKIIATGVATFNGTIENEGDPAYSERGFVYDAVRNPTVDDNIKKPVSGKGKGIFSSNLTGLVEGNIYYVRAYATNDKGTAYGEEVICDFNAKMPVVTTLAVSDIDVASARFNGRIESMGDLACIERGFVYGTMPIPTIEDGAKKTASGTGTGEFSANISELTTGVTYYVCAYATNSKGTAYGVPVSFKPESPYYAVLPSAGIMVQKQDIAEPVIVWESANTLCENSTVGGYTDWRLPTIDELTIIYGERNSIGGFKNNWYWSATYLGLYYGTAAYYYINFSNGSRDAPSYRTMNYARAVRSLP